MNSKKLITLLVLTTLILGLFPVVQVNAVVINALSAANGDKGDTIEVTGAAGDVTSGYEVKLYWDTVKAWDGEEGLLNSTTADPDGSWEVWFDVPEATVGDHYLWIKDMTSGDTDSDIFTVFEKASLSSSSGLAEDEVTVKGYGFAANKDVALILVDNAAAPTTAAVINEDTGEDGDGAIDEFEFTLANAPIEPGTVVIEIGGGADWTDAASDGKLTDGVVNNGTVNYVTGEVEIGWLNAPGQIDADYSWFDDAQDATYVMVDDGETDVLGSFEDLIEIPADADMATAAYEVLCLDNKGNTADPVFTKGPVITLDVDEGPTGTKVEVSGRGFTGGNDELDDGEIRVVEDGGAFADGVNVYIKDLDANDEIDIDADGEFECDIFIPYVEETGDYNIIVDAGVDGATADFKVTGLPSLEFDVEHGVQGSKITVYGYNFTQESGVDVDFAVFTDGYAIALLAGEYDVAGDAENEADFGQTLETDENGEVEGTLTLPAVDDDNYDIVGYQDDYNLFGDGDFRVSLMVVVLSSDSGVCGAEITMTGSGFVPNGEANATMASETLFKGDAVGAGGSFSKVFYVPTLDVGEYTITVTDEESDITVDTTFEVTEATYLVLDPVEAPNDYNVSIEGYYFTTEAANKDLTFVFYNKTAAGAADEDWDDIDVKQFKTTDANYRDAELNANGNFTAWFLVPDDKTFDLGTYYINCTDDGDLFAQISFSIVSETEEISNKKSVYAIGDIVAFDISNSFAQDDSYIKIEDPDGNLYWETETFDDDAGDWVSVGDVKKVPYFLQLSNGQPMELASDAPLVDWTWTWYEANDDEIKSGVFSVEAAAESVVAEQVEDLNTAIDGLTSDISTVSDSVAGLQTDISGAIAAANAATDAANAATEAINAVASQAGDAATAAQQAAEAAADAKNAASGLTTLVYGAIGASLVAALAAIVSLMQISRRIAG